MSEVYITSAVRTAVGSLGKSLKNISAENLGAAVISESIKNNLLGLDICIHNFFLFPSINSNEKASSISFGSLESII